nr:tRNA-dihydrouridine(16/17) synthase [NAD(P)(+)]-like [Lepeophtheirus salmonis]
MEDKFYRSHGHEDKFYCLAPMVDNSGYAYRKLAKKYGSNLCFTEMINCESYLRGQQKIYLTEEDRLRIQICGNDPDIMLKVAQKVERFSNGIDINFGCPQKVAKRGNYGAYLQKNWALTEEIVHKLSKNLSKDLSCKIRIFEDTETTIKYCRMIQDSGCKLLIVHGRTIDQRGMNTGLASWEMIKNIKKSVTIPVIANGNVAYQKDIQKCLDYTDADGIMVGETHLYNPLIYSKEDKHPIEILKEYLTLCDQKEGFGEIKSHVYKILYDILKDQPDYMIKLNKARNISDFLNILYELEQNLEKEYRLSPKLRFPYMAETY